MASSKPTAPHCGAFLLPVLHGQRMGADSTRQAPGCDPACAWSWHWCSPGKGLPWEPVIELVQAQMLVLVPNQGQAQALGAGAQPGQAQAVGAGDRAGAGAALGFNQAKPWPWVPVLNQGKPRLWPGLRLEPAQVQMLVLNQAKRRPWPQLQPSPSPGCRCWCSAGLQPGKDQAVGADSMGRVPAHTHGSTSNVTAQNQVKRFEYWNV
mgnify:FL=1